MNFYYRNVRYLEALNFLKSWNLPKSKSQSPWNCKCSIFWFLDLYHSFPSPSLFPVSILHFYPHLHPYPLLSNLHPHPLPSPSPSDGNGDGDKSPNWNRALNFEVSPSQSPFPVSILHFHPHLHLYPLNIFRSLSFLSISIPVSILHFYPHLCPYPIFELDLKWRQKV